MLASNVYLGVSRDGAQPSAVLEIGILETHCVLLKFSLCTETHAYSTNLAWGIWVDNSHTVASSRLLRNERGTLIY
jgi:hypothetical protein